MAAVDENLSLDQNAPAQDAPAQDAPAHEGSAPDAANASAEPAAAPRDAGPKVTAIDTGKRVDPALLGRSHNNNSNTIRRSEPARSDLRREPARERAPATSPSTQAQGADDTAATTDARPLSPARGREPDDRGDRPRADRAPPAGASRDGPPRRDPRREGGRDAGRGTREERPRGPSKPTLDFKDMKPIVVTRDSEDVGDFAAMLAETGPIDRVDVRIGDRVKARCVHVGTDTVFFELSRTQEAHMAIAEFLDEDGNIKIRVGDKVDAFVVGLGEGILLSGKLGKDMIDVGMLEQARVSGMPITGTVTGVNKGGIEVSLGGTARGFCPLGQIAAGFTDDPASLIGKSLAFLVKEVKENGRNILLSRRALVEKENREKAEVTLRTLAIGQQIQGSVTRLQPFGAFVDIGGLDGLIPMSELGWGHVRDAAEVVKVGDLVTVEVKKIDFDTVKAGMPRVSLSLKAAQPDPFIAHLGDLERGAVLIGTIKKLEAFGAFVELWPGVQGLVHISEVADRRIAHPKDVLNLDEKVQVRVIDTDTGARRISLSMREAPQTLDTAVDNQPQQARVPQVPRMARGQMVEGTVERIEKYGVFVKLDPLVAAAAGAPEQKAVSALLPGSESGTPRGADLNKAFPLGTRLSLLIIEVDERGRLKVSKLAREQAEERELVKEFNSAGNVGTKGGKATGSAGLGTFSDLLKGKLGSDAPSARRAK